MNTLQEKYAYLFSIGYKMDNSLWRHPSLPATLDDDEPNDWKWSTPVEFVAYLLNRAYSRGFDEGQKDLRRSYNALMGRSSL